MDIYRALIAVIGPGKTHTAAYDLIFWLGTTVWAFVYLLTTTTGEGHLYIVFLLAAGYFLEQRLVGRQLRAGVRGSALLLGRCIAWVFSALATTTDTVLSTLVMPYRFLYRIIKKPLRKLLRLACKPVVAAKNRCNALPRRALTWWRGKREEK